MGFSALIEFGYEFGFSSISKHRYETCYMDIYTHSEPIPRLFLRMLKITILLFYINKISNPTPFHLISKNVSVSGLTRVLSLLFPHLTPSVSLFYNTTLLQGWRKLLFVLQEMVCFGYRDEIPDPVGDRDEIQFLFHVGPKRHYFLHQKSDFLFLVVLKHVMFLVECLFYVERTFWMSFFFV